MSLINDALRKARQAAAEHEERQPESAFRAPKAYPSRGPRRRGGAVSLVLVAATAGLAGAALVWWTLDRGHSTVATADRLVGDTAPEPVADSPPLSATRSIENPPADLKGDAVDPPDSRAAEAEILDGEAVRGQTIRAPTPLGEQPATAPPPTSPGTSEAPPVNQQRAARQRVFVLDADLGYASLSLGYIVARTVRPFAEINDIEVYVGSEVAGFVVEKIEADQVTLRDARGELVLTVK